LASPIFYEIDIFDLRQNSITNRIITNKYIYLISSFTDKNTIDKSILRYARHDGILCIFPHLKQPVGVIPGEYYIFVSDSQLENYKDTIIKHICNGPITIKIDNSSILIPGATPIISPSTYVYTNRLYYGKYSIGQFTDTEKEMIVRRYGHGKKNNKAIFLIGRIHGNEHGAQDSIEIMENYIKGNPSAVPEDTSVYILNPANNSDIREIRGKDPNRNFLDKDLKSLNETEAIALFTETIALQWKVFTIISAHQYDDNDNAKKRIHGKGYVFPLYNLTDEGLKNIKDKPGNSTEYLKIGVHYRNDNISDVLAINFKNKVKFIYEPMWKYKIETNIAEMYPGEYIYFVSRLNLKLKKSIRMIEYEIPQSSVDDDKITDNDTINGLVDIIKFFLEGKI